MTSQLRLHNVVALLEHVINVLVLAHFMKLRLEKPLEFVTLERALQRCPLNLKLRIIGLTLITMITQRRKDH